ncbi:quinone oxidoreductase PIG3 [Aplysia californica]|uniref:Quinone oxidoreductase PIG3 n=1 Tax=Aplysia californica TaxID=6500 RepID=A0ABM0JLQ0_APLCA|nr:quinone oxidoreductase PIG3 [Aplysia californica]
MWIISGFAILLASGFGGVEATQQSQDIEVEAPEVTPAPEITIMSTMKAAAFSPGGAENLYTSDVAIPEPGDYEVRIRVLASAINRADTLQRKGLYNPPPDASPILGLEAAGIVDKIGPGCPDSVLVGQKVMALLAGGGNAEYVTCRYEQIMPIPKGLSMIQAAAIPEVWLTAFQLLYFVGKLRKEDTVLIHAGGSGVGTAAVQLVTQAGATAIVTAGSQKKIDFAKSLGAKHGFNYKEGSFKDKVLQATDGKGVDLILDCVFGSMYDDDAQLIKLDGRWVVYGFLGGSQKEANFNMLLRKRVQLLFSNLRFRSVEYKKQLVQEFSNLSTPLFESGAFKPIVDTVLPLSEISQAHKLMESNTNMGKIVLKVSDETSAGKDEL